MNGLDIQGQNNGTSIMIPEKGIDVKYIINHLFRHINIILICSLFGGIFSFLHTFTIVPVYQTSALLKMSTPQSSSSGMLAKLGGGSGEDSGINTQEALIRTRYILEPVIIKNHLNIQVSPHYFPVIGEIKANRYEGSSLAKPFLGLASYAWGGENIEVDQFEVPSNLENKSFLLVADNGPTYKLYSPEGNLMLVGKVGELYEINGIKLRIKTLIANPKTNFDLRVSTPIFLIDSLSRRIKTVNIYGNDPMGNTGIFQVNFTDTIPERAMKTLNSIVAYIVEKNKIEKNEETQRSINFLNQKFPEVKSNLEKTENSLNKFHSQNIVLTMGTRGASLVQKMNMTEQLIAKLKTEQEELLQIYTDKHPLVITNIKKQEELSKQLERIKSEVSKFPMKNQQEIDLVREMKVKNSLYINVINDQAKLEFAKSRITSDIKIISDAMPPSRLPTHKGLLTIAGFLVGAFLASLLIIVKNALSHAIQTVEQIEENFNVPIQAIIPFSKKQKEMEKIHAKLLEKGELPKTRSLILAKEEPEDLAVENFRSLRISLEIMHSIIDNKVIAVMGSVSNIGRSFVSLNLAQVMADSGKRTLLIDADIRRGRVHTAFNQQNSNGLSEYLEGKCNFDKILRKDQQNLYFISCGKYSNHPLMLLQSEMFKNFIAKVKSEFDQVIIDTPAILPVSDSLLIAKYCDTKLLVVSAGIDTIKDVKEAIKKAKVHEVLLNGIILNHRDALASHVPKQTYRYVYKTEA